MRTVKAFLFIGLAAFLAACAGPAPTEAIVDPGVSRGLVISDARVSGQFGEKTRGRPMPADRVVQRLEEEVDRDLVGSGPGPRRAVVDIVLTDVNIISAGQSIMIGGESLMVGHVRLVDARTGAVLMPETKVQAGGGGWVAGGLIAASTLEAPETEVRQMSQEFVARTKTLIFGL